MDALTGKNILLVGPGALGTYFTARLGQKFRRLWVLDHRAARAAHLQEHGFHVKGASVFDWVAPDGRVGTAPRGWPVMDAAFFLVKAPALAAAVKTCRPVLGKQTRRIFLQNGWEPEKGAVKKGAPGVVLGVTDEASTLESAGHVFHAAAGTTWLDGSARGAVWVARLMNEAGFDVELVRNFRRARWSKLVVNACVNPLGALADVPNGRLGQPPLKALLERVTDECLRLSAAGGVRLSPADIRRRVQRVVEHTAENRNSLWQDLRRRRPTERAYLLGPFLDIARRRRQPAPFLNLLDRLIQGVERLAL